MMKYTIPGKLYDIHTVKRDSIELQNYNDDGINKVGTVFLTDSEKSAYQGALEQLQTWESLIRYRAMQSHQHSTNYGYTAHVVCPETEIRMDFIHCDNDDCPTCKED
jgi:hypothetical protein